MGPHVLGALRAKRISSGELDVLTTLVEQGGAGARPGSLASQLLLTTGGLSNILRRLEARRLVERAPDERDARGSLVRVTGDGVVVANEARAAVDQAIDRVLSPLVAAASLDEAAQALHRLLVELAEDAPVHRGGTARIEAEGRRAGGGIRERGDGGRGAGPRRPRRDRDPRPRRRG